MVITKRSWLHHWKIMATTLVNHCIMICYGEIMGPCCIPEQNSGLGFAPFQAYNSLNLVNLCLSHDLMAHTHCLNHG